MAPPDVLTLGRALEVVAGVKRAQRKRAAEGSSNEGPRKQRNTGDGDAMPGGAAADNADGGQEDEDELEVGSDGE